MGSLQGLKLDSPAANQILRHPERSEGPVHIAAFETTFLFSVILSEVRRSRTQSKDPLLSDPTTIPVGNSLHHASKSTQPCYSIGVPFATDVSSPLGTRCAHPLFFATFATLLCDLRFATSAVRSFFLASSHGCVARPPRFSPRFLRDLFGNRSSLALPGSPTLYFLARRMKEYRLSGSQSPRASDRAINPCVVLVRANDRLHHLGRRTCRVGIKVHHRAA